MLTRRTALLSAAAAVAVSACATPGPAESGANPLDAFFEAAFERQLDRAPQFATTIGDKRNYDRWDDPSEAAEEARHQAQAADVAALRALVGDGAGLEESRLLSVLLFEDRFARAQAGRPFRDHAYRFNQMFGAQSGVPAFLINQHRVASVADAEAYIARLAGVEAYLGGVLARSEAGAARGLMPPRFVYDYVLADCRNILADNPLVGDIAGKVAALDAPDGVKQRLISQANAAIESHVAPAYRRLIEVLSTQQARAGTDDGVWRLPEGEAYYAERLATQTTTTMTADEIHDFGLAEVARIQEEMRTIMRQVSFSGDLQAFYRFMENDPQFYLPTTEEGKAEYIRRAQEALDAMIARAPAFFSRMPRAGFEVRPVEPFREQSAGLAFYQRPSADGARPGIYYANTYDMRALPLYQLEALAYHEAIPGHHFQIALQQELEGVPRFRRFGGYTAYSEGWALYCELLAKEMGFYRDPYSDFGRLTMEIRRAIRLVVDTGLHHKRWPRQQAIDYILATQPGDEAQARRDIDRYIVMPGQATAYKIGMTEILRAREAARAGMGARFDIRAFHDVVLASGAVPLNVMAQRVAAWARV